MNSTQNNDFQKSSEIAFGFGEFLAKWNWSPVPSPRRLIAADLPRWEVACSWLRRELAELDRRSGPQRWVGSLHVRGCAKEIKRPFTTSAA